MASQKDLRISYQSKNNATGLTDITAQIYLNGTAVAVGVNAIAHTANANGSKVNELDSTNSPGGYEVLIKAADLTAWGVAQGTAYYLEAYINSSSHSAASIWRAQILVADNDDIDVKLGTPAGASVSADIASIKSDTSAIKTDLESGPNSLATLNSALQTLQNAVLQSGVGIVLPKMLIPASGTNTYKIPITIQDDAGALVDPTSNLVTVGVLNQSGTDRGSNLTGSSGSPATVAATRDGVGQYHVIVTIGSSQVEEQWIFSLAYTVSGNAMVRYAASLIESDLTAAGLALQSTLLDVQGDVDNVETIVTEIATDTDTIITNVASVQADTTAIKGSGFTPGVDDLHSLSAYVNANLFQGGRAF